MNFPPLNLQPQAFSTPARASSVASSGSASNMGGQGAKPKLSHRQRVAANQRERRRMTSLNTAFDVLRRCLPEGRARDQLNKKPLSKVDTLRVAIEYIAKMQAELADFDIEAGLLPTLVPIQGQLVRQLPDSAERPPKLPVCFPEAVPSRCSATPGETLTPPAPVFCFGGMVQHSQSNRTTPIAPIPPDTKFAFQFQPDSRLAMACSGYLTPGSTSGSSSSSYPSPPLSCSYNNSLYQLSAAASWYC